MKQFWISPLPSEMQIYKWYQIVYQNSEFRLSQVNRFRLINQGHGNTLKLCHPLLSCKITNKTYFLFELSISSLLFKLSKNAWKERQQQSQWQTLLDLEATMRYPRCLKIRKWGDLIYGCPLMNILTICNCYISHWRIFTALNSIAGKIDEMTGNNNNITRIERRRVVATLLVV